MGRAMTFPCLIELNMWWVALTYVRATDTGYRHEPMKICPTCKETYKDDELNFCLKDGATLLRKKNGTVQRHSRANEVVAVALLAAAVLMFLCLVSNSPDDRSIFSTGFGGTQRTQNWIGVVGANIAAVLINGVGWIAYLLPALVALIAWKVFQSANLKPRVSVIVGVALFVVAASGLAYLIDPTYGGIIGKLFPYFAIPLISKLGTGILLTTFFILSLLLLTNLSFLGFFGNFDLAWENFKIRFAEWKARRQGNRSAQIEVAKGRSDKRKEARDEKVLTDAPTIIGGAAAASIAENTRASSAAASAVAKPADSNQPPLEFETPSVPTISPTDKIPDTVVTNELDSGELLERNAKLGHIPITPTKHTGELNGETNEPTIEDEPPVERPKKPQSYDDYILPWSYLLNPAAPHIEQKEKELLAIADSLAEKTKEFNVAGKVVNICPGPVVTTYEFKPDPGVKYSRVTGLVDDLCLALKAESIRIDRIPGKAFVGIEVPNRKRETIQLRDVIESKKFKDSDSLLTIALGKTIDGLNYVTDLAKMPHLLIAGATGAGKSVGVNSLVVSILYKARPDQVKFIMVDPKRLELGVYADIPHLATPIITDPKRAAISLRWAVTEMERRYKDLAGYGVRNIDGYNIEAKRRNKLEQWDDNGDPHRTLPYIVIIIDELADLMMVSGKEVEDAITRLAQMARAVGIHLVLATQRPSVDVITGLIKANFPARISFRVSSKVDSRTIIDGNGAESLLGKGDMLFLPPATSQVLRVHGAFVDEKEIGKIVEHIKAQGRPEYDTTITKSDDELDDSGDLPGRRDPLFSDALKTVVNAKRGSTSLLQRHLRIGYGRAAAILDAMVREGYIGDMDGSTRARPVLQKAYDDLQDLEEMNDG